MTQNKKRQTIFVVLIVLLVLFFIFQGFQERNAGRTNADASNIASKDANSSANSEDGSSTDEDGQIRMPWNDTSRSSVSEESASTETEDQTQISSDISKSTIVPLETTESISSDVSDAALAVDFGQDYYEMEDVAAYLHLFEELPPNYVTKNEAYDAGWEPSEGNLWDVLPGAVIGGDKFGNREGLLPNARYYEADVNYEGGHRGAERLVFTEDGEIYYTSDHYESFERVY